MARNEGLSGDVNRASPDRTHRVTWIRKGWIDTQLQSSALQCVICDNPDARPRDVLLELANSWVTAHTTACLPGYVCVISRRHVEEPYEGANDNRGGEGYQQYD